MRSQDFVREVEQLNERIDVVCSFPVFGQLLQLRRRRVQQFVRELAQDHPDTFSLLFREVGQFRTFQFLLHNPVEALPEGHDCRLDIQTLLPGTKSSHFLDDDMPGFLGFFLSLLEIRPDNRL